MSSLRPAEPKTNGLRPPTPKPLPKMGERGWTTWDKFAVVVCIILIAALVWVFYDIAYDIANQPSKPSIYKDDFLIPLLQYLSSDNYLTIEDIDDHFTHWNSSREKIINELTELNDDNYVQRVFEDGLYYYHLTEWGAVYLNYLEARLE